MTVKNAQGEIFYGMHFYPGVAEYREPGKDPYRVFLNEDTLRTMDPSFAGCPIFVEHVEEVEENLDELRKEADGWVTESFYNSADGKHWVKFVIVSERGKRAIKSGLRLSNAYIPEAFSQGGQWNGVSYTREITKGKFEHLAIVRNPRYEESVILSPENFKKYNEEKVVELKRLANSKGEPEMKLNFFKKTKVENASDLEGVSVTLPKSQKEMTIEQMVAEMDKVQNMDGYASQDHVVKIHDGSEMKVSELVKKHEDCMNELSALKAKKDEPAAEGDESKKKEDEVKPEAEPEKKKEDAQDEGDKKDLMADDKDEEIEAAKKKNAKEKADKLRNAHLNATEDEEEVVNVELSSTQIARGKSRYGSN